MVTFYLRQPATHTPWVGVLASSCAICSLNLMNRLLLACPVARPNESHDQPESGVGLCPLWIKTAVDEPAISAPAGPGFPVPVPTIRPERSRRFHGRATLQCRATVPAARDQLPELIILYPSAGGLQEGGGQQGPVVLYFDKQHCVLDVCEEQLDGLFAVEEQLEALKERDKRMGAESIKTKLIKNRYTETGWPIKRDPLPELLL